MSSRTAKNQHVCVIGLGYIGLPTASFLATRGYQVLGVDVLQDVVDTINRGEMHIHEPDLDVMVKSAVGSGRLTAATEPQPAEIYILAVPTPFKDSYVPDMSYVDAATRALAPHVPPGALIILESTSPVGATQRMAETLFGARPDLSLEGEDRVYIAHCPERVLPGKVLQELVANDRIVGGIDTLSARKGADFYNAFVQGEVLQTDCRTAELAKLVENSFRDVNIAFANELSLICDRLGIDVWELIRLSNRHPRVNILQPGPGVGGHCIAVDPWFIIDSAPEDSRLIRTAREVNDGKPAWVLDQVRQAAATLDNPKIACLGLAFKANIDDVRESPALAITSDLVASGIGTILAADPFLDGPPESIAGSEWCDWQAAIAAADIVLLLVDHAPFKQATLAMLEGKKLIDTRGLWGGLPRDAAG